MQGKTRVKRSRTAAGDGLRRPWVRQPMDAGERVSWSVLVREWPRETVTRTGTVWSQGPVASAWWVMPDGEAAAVLVRRTGKRARDGYAPGDLREDPGAGEAAAQRIVRAERVRARGLAAVVHEVIPARAETRYQRGYPEVACVVWHCDRDCPDAAGKPVHAGGYARGYHEAFDTPWTVASVAAYLAGVLPVRDGEAPPLCPRCVLAEDVPALVTA